MRLSRSDRTRCAPVFRAALLLAASLAPTALAGNYYWTGDNAANGTSWSAVAGLGGTNWSLSPDFNNGAPTLPGASDDVFFYLTGVNLNTVLGQDFSIHSLNFTSDATNPVTVGGGNLLTLGAGGLTVQSGSAAHVINTNVALGASQTWTNNSANVLTVNGVISGTGNLTIAGTAGSGGVTFTGANAYTGTTTLGGLAVLTLSGANGSLATSAVALGGGSVLNLDNTAAGNANRIGDAVPITSNGGTINLKGATAAETLGPVTLSTGATRINVDAGGTLTLGSAATAGLVRNTGGTVNFSATGSVVIPNQANTNGIIGPHATIGNIGVVQQDAAGNSNVLDFAAVDGTHKVVPLSTYNLNDFSAATNNVKVNQATTFAPSTTTTINSLYLTGAATVQIGTVGTAGVGQANVSTLIIGSGGIISNGATLTLGGSGPQIDMTNSAELGSGVVNGTNSNGGNITGNLTVGTSPTLAADLVVTTASNLRITSTITDNGTTRVTLVKNGSGTLDLSSGNNGNGGTAGSSPQNQNSGNAIDTYSGGIVINGGLVIIRNDRNLGAIPSLTQGGTAANVANAITLNGGEFRMTATITVDSHRGITVGPQGGTISYNGGNTTNLASFQITGPGAITYSNIPSFGIPTGTNQCATRINFPSGANNYQGATTFFTQGSTNAAAINSVIILSQNDEVPDNSPVTVTNNDGKGVLNLFGHSDVWGSLAGNGNILNSTATVSNLTVGQNNLSTTYSGSLGKTGVTWSVGAAGANGDVSAAPGTTAAITLTKNGTGALTMSGVNGYTGATTVNAGALLIGSGTTNTSTASLAATTVTVNGGALGGNGTINGPVIIGAAGHLAPAMSPTTTNTLTINNNLTLNAGATLDFNFGAAGSPGTGDLVNVTGTGNANLLAGNDVLNITPLTGFGIGTYTLISVTGTGALTNNATFTVNGSVRFNYAVGVTGNNLVLTVTQGNPLLTWIGNGSGNWQVGGPTNWNDGTSAVAFANGNNVVFDDNGVSAAPSVSVDAAGVSPNTMSVANSSGTYTFAGGPITVANAFTKSQFGNVTFNDNVTTGITTISGGQVTVGASSTFAATSRVDLNGGTLTVNGTLTTGTLNLNGGTLQTPGTVKISANGTIGVAAAVSTPQTFGGNVQALGALTINNNGTGGLTFTSPFTLAAGGTAGTLTFSGSGNTTYAGNIAAGAVTGVSVTGPGSATLSGNNGFTGGVSVTGGTLNVNSPTALGTGPFTLNGGAVGSTAAAPVTVTTNNPISLAAAFGVAGTQSLNMGTGATTLAGDTTVTVSGTGTVTFPTLAFSGQSLTLAGAGTGGIALPANQSIANLNNGSSGTVALGQPGGSISVSGTLFNSGTGTTALNANTTVGGVFRVYGGTLNQPDPNTYQFSVTGGGLAIGPGVTVTANNLTLGGSVNGTGETSGQITLGAGASLAVNSTADIRIGDNSTAATNPIGAIISGGPNSSLTLQSSAAGIEIGGGGAGTGQRANVLISLGSGTNVLAAPAGISLGGPGPNPVTNHGGGGEDGDFSRGNNLGQTLLVLGAGTNTITTPQLFVSGYKSPASIFLANGPVAMSVNTGAGTATSTYAPPVPILLKGGGFPTATLNSQSGSMTLFVGYQTDPTAAPAASGTNSIGVLDTTGGILNGTFATVTLGLNDTSPSSTHGGGVGSWVLGVANNAVTVDKVVMTNTPAPATPPAQGITGAVFSLNGGTVTFNAPGSGGFAFGGDAGATTTVVNLNGGTLNMNGNPVNDPNSAPAPFTAFGFNGGTLRNATGIFVNGGLTQNGGVLLRDQAGTTTIGAAAAAPTTVYMVAGGAVVQLNAPAASLVALSAGSLSRATAGTLDIVPVTGNLAAASGQQELVQFATAPAAVNGILPAWVVARTNGTATSSADFTTYNGAVNSVARFTAYSTGDLNAASPTGVANPAADTVLTSSPTVYALKLSRNVTSDGSGTRTLTIGAAGSPSGLILDGGSIAANALAFASEAVVYATAQNGTITSPVTANGDLTKFGPGQLTLGNTAANSVGGINVNAGVLRVNGPITASGPVSVRNGGSLAGTGTVTASGANGVALGPNATLAPGGTTGPNFGVLTIATAGGNLTTAMATTNPTTLTSASLGWGLGISPTNVVGSVISLNLTGTGAATGAANSGASNANTLGTRASGFLFTSSGGGLFNLDPITTVRVNADPATFTNGASYSYLVGTVPAGSTGAVTNEGNFFFSNNGGPVYTANLSGVTLSTTPTGGVYLNFVTVPVPEPALVCLAAAAAFAAGAAVGRRRAAAGRRDPAGAK